MTVPSYFAKVHNGGLQCGQIVVRYVTDDIDRIVDTNNLATTPVALGDNFLLLNGGWHGDGVARILTITHVNANAGVARGAIVDLYGRNQFGETVHERITFANHAVNDIVHTFTTNAYLYVTRVVLIARTGVQANDRLDIGAAHVAGTVAGTLDTRGGLVAAGRYKGFGLPIQVTAGTDEQGAASADHESEVIGCFIAQAADGVETSTIMARTNEFLVDPNGSVMVPDEEFATTGAANVEYHAWVASRVGV